MGFATFQVSRTMPLGASREGRAARPVTCTSEEVLSAFAAWLPAGWPSEEGRPLGAHATVARTVLLTIPDGAPPFEAFPSPTAVPRHRGRCPPAISPVVRGRPPAASVRR